MPVTASIIEEFRDELENHPVYDAISTVEDLRCFMEHHVYSVWDFMSLIKYLQSVVAPARFPWTPQGEGGVVRFINELVLEEESDQGTEPGRYGSHFELYRQAMGEIGADVGPIGRFIDTVASSGIEAALRLASVPEPSRRFTSTTFRYLGNNKPHEVAAALALGREHIIPRIFRSIIRHIGVQEAEAPSFHYYLGRHIHLDEDFHAPLSLRLLDALCAGDPVRIGEAQSAAAEAVRERIRFWDGVLDAIEARRRETA